MYNTNQIIVDVEKVETFALFHLKTYHGVAEESFWIDAYTIMPVVYTTVIENDIILHCYNSSGAVITPIHDINKKEHGACTFLFSKRDLEKIRLNILERIKKNDEVRTLYEKMHKEYNNDIIFYDYPPSFDALLNIAYTPYWE